MDNQENNEATCPQCGSEAIEWRVHDTGWLCSDCEHQWKGPAPPGANSVFEQGGEIDPGDMGGGEGD